MDAPKSPGKSPLDDAFDRLIYPLRSSLIKIEERLNEAAEGREAASVMPAAIDLSPLEDRLIVLSGELAELRRELMERSDRDTETPDDAGRSELWEEIILGELCAEPSVAAVRDEFLADVVSGVLAARALAGQLLLLQATIPDELPERFRHVGEAYYRWRPKTSRDPEPLERALAGWLKRRAEAAGLPNSIELVSPGDRFDSLRHAATTRGIQIVEVQGWIVLRDNQKVYTKATVTVQ